MTIRLADLRVGTRNLGRYCHGRRPPGGGGSRHTNPGSMLERLTTLRG